MNSEEHQKKANSGNVVIDTLASLKLTVLLLILSMILILLGTLEQVHWGIWHVQKVYFSSWLCFYPMDPTAPLRIPLPAGFTLGALLIINLAFAHVRHFKATAAKVGNLMIHAGLLLLLGGGFVTAIYQEESAMIIPEGEKRNYSEAFREFEIALVQKSATAGETVVAIPDSILRTIGEKIVSANKLSEKNTAAAKKLAEDNFAYAIKMPPKEAAAFLKNAESKAKKVSEATEEKASLAAKALLQESLITLPGTPYTLVVQTYHPNAMIRAKSQMSDGLPSRQPKVSAPALSWPTSLSRKAMTTTSPTLPPRSWS